jgi:hypothetical protein
MIGSVLVLGTILCLAIKNWYIVPYEDLKRLYTLQRLEHETNLKTKNELINKMSIEIETLKAKLKKATNKNTKKVSKPKILEKFDTKSVIKSKK